MEYYIYNIPVFSFEEPQESVDIGTFCKDIENIVPANLLKYIEVVYIGEFKGLQNKNAAYSNGGIYMTADEPTNFDMIENFVHEVAHSLEGDKGWLIYDDSLLNEFLGKRRRLRSILEQEGYHISPELYTFTEYNKTFDEFLANEVGYPRLLNLTMGLFVSPYGATSIQEYFANGFEKYFLDGPDTIRDISPVLYEKIDTILNE
tara:strand:+ start:479 stop:1090 length:612 start_codon:yes stop_codon:yes gene_type:complete